MRDRLVDRIADPWGPRTPYDPPAGRSGASPWPVRVDRFLVDGLTEEDVERWVPAASVLHSNGDAYELAVAGSRIVGVRGRAGDRVNHGRLGPKDLFGWQATASDDRLRRPQIRSGGRLVECDWDTAMEAIVARSRDLLAEPGGPGRFGFYTSGQLALEDYYTLGVIGKAGIGTPHMDGNTRLCTATAAAALKASFGTDGQPGSYTDIDHCDAIALWGHNVAETQTVLWARMLDRRCGRQPPRMLAVDPRRTPVAREADVHLAIRSGTNLALMNGLLREVIRRGWIDDRFVAAHTIGFDDLRAVVDEYTPDRVAGICDVRAADVEAAAELVGTSSRLVSTVLQGFYQSPQATAAACQVNNLHLVRGMIGRPGAGVLQMNGQPTAQNTRECGANGDLPGMRNWANAEHVDQLAHLWRVDPMTIPSWAPPTHAMQLFRYAEQGSIRLLWISGTNPAVSMPDVERIRSILSDPDLFVVVQDAFASETVQLADVVLPAATWGERTGTFTNADRTVHLSERAVDPPGEARVDLEIFLDYAERMGFRNRDGDPLIDWHDAESAFEAWKRCARGRPCDYSGLTYDRLRAEGGIQWPCNDEHPDGLERLYANGRFNTEPDECETFGYDLVTGAEHDETDYRAGRPRGRAFLRAAHHDPTATEPDADFPLQLTTGRTVYQFHTRTKTGRSPQLQAAAPDVWVELSAEDAAHLGVLEGDVVRVCSGTGELTGRARLSCIRAGTVFVPFHYGPWQPDGDRPGRAANLLTSTTWDPVSKQPCFKLAAARVEKVADGDGAPAPAPTTGAAAPVSGGVPPTVGGAAAHVHSRMGATP